jgi:N-acetyl-gamma-glutamyl-phosphate reductase
VDVVLLEHRSESEEKPQPLGNRPPRTIPADSESIRREGLDLVFLGTPPEVSIEITPGLLAIGVKVIDLSGAFRLREGEVYSQWYKQRHPAPDLLSAAVYGLPEFYRDQIPGAQLIANPGCYPTAANLAIRPLVQAEVADRSRGIICDAKSGVSGAGRKPTLKSSFCEVTENFSAYGILDHRHVPEVLQNSGLGEREFTFTAHLLPIERGILETIYVRTLRIEKAVDLLAIYEEAYANEPFVRLYAPGKVPDIRAVQHTNFCDIGFVFDAESRRAVLISVIDNLMKGAAGQAVQNMNLVLGFPETEALL